MNRLHTASTGPLALAVPVSVAVGRVEWVEVNSRLYGADSVGNVFVFRLPFTTPRHVAKRRRGHVLRRLVRAYLKGVRRVGRRA